MIKQLVLLTLLVLCGSPATAIAAGETERVVELRTAPAALDPARAYLLFRATNVKFGTVILEHTFLRIPTQAEADMWRAARDDAFEAALPKLRRSAKAGEAPSVENFPFDYQASRNTFSTHRNRFLIKGDELRTFLLEIPPGDYLVYGISQDDLFITCNCLGSVSFAARPGVITNLGTLYADEVSHHSDFSILESDLGKGMSRPIGFFGQALAPAAADEAVPEVLRGFTIEVPELQVVTSFQDHSAMLINRLAPIPGVLAYERGKAADVRVLESRHAH